jgi:hypothetical protein
MMVALSIRRQKPFRGRVMTNPSLRTPFGEVELRPVSLEPGATPNTYVLLPDLDELLGVPGFGLASPIHVPARARGIVLQ